MCYVLDRFVFLQVFMAPARPSFKSQIPQKGEDPSVIVDHQMLGAITTLYCCIPTGIQMLIGAYQLSLPGIFQVWFLVNFVLLYFYYYFIIV